MSDTMLDLARRNIERLPAGVRKRLHLVRANMSDFDLGRKFGLIFIADNSFRELNTRKKLLACLRHIRRHLKLNGRLLITEHQLDPSLFPNGRRAFGWSDPHKHPETGDLVCRRGEIRLSKSRRRIHGKFFYKTIHSDGTKELEVCPWNAPVLTKEEYLSLFSKAGFDAEVYADYKEKRDNESGRLFCFVCQPCRLH